MSLPVRDRESYSSNTCNRLALQAGAWRTSVYARLAITSISIVYCIDTHSFRCSNIKAS